MTELIIVKFGFVFRKILTFLALTHVLTPITGCSGFNIGLGGGSSPNDAAPKGNLKGQGTLSGQNSQSVSGTVVVYQANVSDYIVRLEGLTAPSELGMTLQLLDINGEMVGTTSLTALSGTKNYTFSNLETGLKIARVYIYSTATGKIYGTALLQ